MKKAVLILSVLLSIFMCYEGAYAEGTPEETKPFDLSVYESADNYEYDKFDKAWFVYGAYLKEYRDAIVVLGLRVDGNKNAITAPPYIYVWIREENNTDVLYSITGLQFIINDKLFSAKHIDEGDAESALYLDSVNGRELLLAIVAGSEMDVKMSYITGSHVETISGDDYVEIQKVAKLIVDNDSWTYVCDRDGYDITVWDDFINTNFPIVIDAD